MKQNFIQEWMVKKNWQFVDNADRKKTLNDKELGFNEDQLAILTNFDCDGYRLLYYFTKDAIAAVLAGKVERKNEATEESSGQRTTYLDEYLKTYTDGKAAKQTAVVWKAALVEQVRADVQAVEADTTKALRYVYEQRNKADKNGSFFWEVFTAKEILAAIDNQKTQQKEGQQENA